MANLADLPLRTSYHKGQDDIAGSFYLPCMRRASKYDRAVGFFRSTVFVVAWPALRDFIANGGRIRILCSHVLADSDIDALASGYEASADEHIARHFAEEVRQLLNDPVLREPARVLAALVAAGLLEVRVAHVTTRSGATTKERLFHDKLGIFRDSHGNTVIFKGSMNETWTGLAGDGNLESVDVAASWLGARDLERTDTESAYFQQIWDDRYPTLRVRPFPEVAREELERAADTDWDGTLARLSRDDGGAAVDDPHGRTLRPHQSAGLAAWNTNARRGILSFATGSGKTFTAIHAIRAAISEHLNPVLVVVPDQVLFGQWYAELAVTLKDLGVQILRAGAGYSRWRSSLGLYTEPGTAPRLVLATLQTARGAEFRNAVRGGEHLLLVADEVHRLGSTENRQLMDSRLFGPRLGLSATPERAGDPAGTEALITFFDRILEPRYTLADAIGAGVLARYFYRPHTVLLTVDEIAEWRDYTLDISRLYARKSTGDQGSNLDQRIKHLLLKRARVVKRAAGKVPLAVEVLRGAYRAGDRWIVYCDDLAQLTQVQAALDNAGFGPVPFHSQMEGDRQQTLRWLDRRGGVLVAIKCLDEGVDVPSVTHALILASSKNPREYIQRRGRVLRTHARKALAYVHDAIVVAPLVVDDAGRRVPDPIVHGELARALQFAQHADNPTGAADLLQIAIEAGIEWRTLSSIGFEDEDDGSQ